MNLARMAAFLGLVLAGTGSSCAAAGVEITATELSVPFFDDAGHLTHRLTARRGSAAGDEQMLEGVEVVYFAAGSREIVQRLRTDVATWRSDAGILAGNGRVSLESGDVRVTGEQFRFELATSVLNIERNFRMSNADLVMTSDRAVVLLAIARTGEKIAVQDVKRCEATGNLHIVVAPAARRKFAFDEAFSANAIYDRGADVITMPHAVRMIRDGREMRSKSAEFKLPARKKAVPAR